MPKITSEPIAVKSFKDDTVALLKHLPVMLPEGYAPCEDDIRACLKKAGITHYINWKAITQALEHVKKTGNAIRDLIIAKAEPCSLELLHKGPDEVYLDDDLKRIKPIWRKLDNILNDKEESKQLLPAYFYKRGDVVFELSFPYVINVKGEKCLDTQDLVSFGINETFDVEKLDDKILLKANVDGYLTVDAKNLIGLHKPIYMSKSNSQLSLKYYPLKNGIKKLQKVLDEKIKEYDIEQKPVIDNCQGAMVYYFILKKGVEPIEGKDASIEWLFKIDDANDQIEEDIIDYKEITPYKKIEAGTLIAIKTPFVKGQEGVDLNGEKISVRMGRDLKIKADKNITNKEVDGNVHYKAGMGGIFFRVQNNMSIENALIVRGDVDLSSGNIAHDGAVIIEGDVKSGFKVQCVNNLVIKGSVENGCNILCNGDIFITRGVIGESTVVESKNACQVGYVTDAKILSKDKLVVDKYAYNAKLFSREIIEINGASVKKGKCALVGGEINSLIEVSAHSISSIQGNTIITLGIDLRLKNHIVSLESTLPGYSKRLLALNKKVAAVSGPNKKKILDSMTAEQKAILIKNVNLIKEVHKEKEKIESTIKKLETLSKLKDMSKATLRVKTGLLPDAQVRIKDTSKVFDAAIKGAFRIKLIDYELVVKRS